MDVDPVRLWVVRSLLATTVTYGPAAPAADAPKPSAVQAGPEEQQPNLPTPHARPQGESTGRSFAVPAVQAADPAVLRQMLESLRLDESELYDPGGYPRAWLARDERPSEP